MIDAHAETIITVYNYILYSFYIACTNMWLAIKFFCLCPAVMSFVVFCLCPALFFLRCIVYVWLFCLLSCLIHVWLIFLLSCIVFVRRFCLELFCHFLVICLCPAILSYEQCTIETKRIDPNFGTYKQGSSLLCNLKLCLMYQVQCFVYKLVLRYFAFCT